MVGVEVGREERQVHLRFLAQLERGPVLGDRRLQLRVHFAVHRTVVILPLAELALEIDDQFRGVGGHGVEPVANLVTHGFVARIDTEAGPVGRLGQLAEELDRGQFDQRAQRLGLAFRLGETHVEVDAELLDRRIGVEALAFLEYHHGIAGCRACEDGHVVGLEDGQIQPQDCGRGVFGDADVDERIESDTEVVLFVNQIFIKLGDRPLDVILWDDRVCILALCLLEEGNEIVGIRPEGHQPHCTAALGHVRDGGNQHVLGAGVDLLRLIDDVLHQNGDVANAMVDHHAVHAPQRRREIRDRPLRRGLGTLPRDLGLLNGLLLDVHCATTGQHTADGEWQR